MPDLPIVKAALEKLQRTEKWTEQGRQFQPYMEAWLNRGGWDDEIPETNGTAATPDRTCTRCAGKGYAEVDADMGSRFNPETQQTERVMKHIPCSRCQSTGGSRHDPTGPIRSHSYRREGMDSRRHPPRPTIRPGQLKIAADEIEETPRASAPASSPQSRPTPDFTTQELAPFVHLSVHTVGRRLPELRTKGLVTNPYYGDGRDAMQLRRCTVQNRLALSWRAV